MKPKVRSQEYVTWQIHTALQFLPSLTVDNHACLLKRQAYKPPLPTIEFVQLRIYVVASVVSATSFTNQGGGIFQAVTQYVTELTASIHTELYCLLTKVTRC
jgi:hypothetical protein